MSDDDSGSSDSSGGSSDGDGGEREKETGKKGKVALKERVEEEVQAKAKGEREEAFRISKIGGF